MYPSSVVRPTSGNEIFVVAKDSTSDEVKFNINPIVFQMPERATRAETNLYIDLQGWLSFEALDENKPRTKSFGTEIGYFRSKRDAIEHVYGAHYDLDENKPGHPVFHAQIGPQMDLLASVKGHFRKDWTTTDDRVTAILPNVRTPSAQMDIFSVITQICADHLMHEKSGPEILAAFSKMRTECDFFTGAAYRMKYLKRLIPLSPAAL